MGPTTTTSLISVECYISRNLTHRTPECCVSRDYDTYIFCYESLDFRLESVRDVIIEPSLIFDVASIGEVVSLRGLEVMISYLLHRDIDEMTG